MSKKAVIGILSFVLMAVSVILSVENQNDIVIGDVILKKLGSNVWSNGNNGLHYTFIISLVLFSVGAISFRIYNKYIPEILIKLIPACLIISIFVYPLTFNSIYNFIKAHSKGVHSIVYVRNESSFNYDVKRESKYITIDAIIALKIYDHESHHIKIKLLPKDSHLGQYIKESTLDAINNDTEKPESIVVCSSPGKTVKFSATFKAKLDDKNFEGQGVMSGIDLMLYDKNSKVKFVN